ncbi:MAG: toll/interleukin-1 receptor domain-containing protein [Gammaproteobacteria bacterium]
MTTVLARRLASDMGNLPPGCDPNDLAHIAQVYLTQHNRDRSDLEILVEEFYAAYQGKCTPLYEHLAALPFRVCIATTPDDFLLNALKAAGKHPKVESYQFRDSRVPPLGAPTEERPLLYRLYGDLLHGDPPDSGSLVLTETDLLDFLVNIISRKPELPPELTRGFSDPKTSFLFMGFGFQRWYLRILLHVLRKELPKSPPRSLALEGTQFFADPQSAQTALFFHHSQAIEFQQCSWDDFASELHRQYQAHKSAGRPGGPAPRELRGDAPTVFLCHKSRDSERVAQIGEVLRERGINTWRDRDDLRGGVNWDRMIQHVIEKQVDYFLVLQTPEMLVTTEAYLFKEIKTALERHRAMAEGFAFIFPAFLEGAGEQKLAELEHLNYVDLRRPEGLSQLVGDIDDDRRRRRERAALALQGPAHAV